MVVLNSYAKITFLPKRNIVNVVSRLSVDGRVDGQVRHCPRQTSHLFRRSGKKCHYVGRSRMKRGHVLVLDGERITERRGEGAKRYKKGRFASLLEVHVIGQDIRWKNRLPEEIKLLYISISSYSVQEQMQ